MTLLTWPEFAFSASALLVAAAARRLTGLGFALLAAPLLSLAMAPQHLVIIILILQVALGVPALAEFRGLVDWPMLRQLAFGGALMAPLGAWLLGHTDTQVLLSILGSVVILSASLLGFAPELLKFRPSRVNNAVCGMMAGALSSSVGMPGPPVAIYFLGQPQLSSDKRRAMLIITFSALASLSLIIAIPEGQVSQELLVLSALFFPIVLLGGQLGEAMRDRVNAAVSRRVSLALVLLSGISCLVRAF
jgi:uncharacterized membrane protein YfcA